MHESVISGWIPVDEFVLTTPLQIVFLDQTVMNAPIYFDRLRDSLAGCPSPESSWIRS